jgi:hypothetical protein
MIISILTVGLHNRNIIIGDFNRGELGSAYRANINEFPCEVTVHRDDLVADACKLAVDASRDLFFRFGWTTVREELLADYQQELVRGR